MRVARPLSGDNGPSYHLQRKRPRRELGGYDNGSSQRASLAVSCTATDRRKLNEPVNLRIRSTKVHVAITTDITMSHV